jgi:hypothetical protein
VPDRRLEIENGSFDNTAAIQIWGANAFDWSSQKWNFLPFGDGHEMRNVRSGKCMDVPGFNFADGVPLMQWSCHGGANQKWSLVPLSSGC